MSESEYPQLTNIHLSYQTIELFLNLVPAQRPFLYYPFIIIAPRGNYKRNLKYFPLDYSDAGIHNQSMENKEYNIVEELSRFQDFVSWARTNFEKLDTDDQISLANFQASAAEEIWFE